MRTNEERTRLIRQRTRAIRQARAQMRRRLVSAAGLTVCLLAVVCIGMLMPGLMDGVAALPVSHTSGAASLVAGHTALGYILMGLLSFFLGVCITVLLYRLRRRSERRREDKDDEL